MEKLIVTVTPTNTKWFKKDNPHLPETPAEIAADVIEAYHELYRNDLERNATIQANGSTSRDVKVGCGDFEIVME